MDATIWWQTAIIIIISLGGYHQELREDVKSLNRKVDELQRANEVASNYYSLLYWKLWARCHYKLY